MNTNMANNEIAADKNSETSEPETDNGGQNPHRSVDGAASVGSKEEDVHCSAFQLMEALVERSNLWKALHRVKANRGSAGVDGMTVDELHPWLSKNWVTIKEKLLNGSYEPQAVKAVDIPKPSGGVRTLGIPTVIDRLIQQGIAQVLTPIFDPHFSENSYGFRAGKNAKQAVRKAQQYQQEGKKWVVDMDLEKFFDKVNHDIMMQCLRERVKDKRLLKLIGKYLRSGIMRNGLESQRTQGTPQGGPLSPLLSNIMLDRFDKELTRRGHSFVRYADDCNIYVNTERAAHRVLESVSNWIEKHLRLKVNRDKSAVGRPWQRKFLGFSFRPKKAGKICIASESIKSFKVKVKALMRRGRGQNVKRFINEILNPLLKGWINYYRITETPYTVKKLDSWLRRRLRNILWRQWKTPKTRRKKLLALGVYPHNAIKTTNNGRGPWFNSGVSSLNVALPVKYFDNQGLIQLSKELKYAEQLDLL